MGVAVQPTWDIGVEAFDAVGEAEPLKEFQRAVDGGRLGRLAVLAERGDQVVSLQRAISLQQQLQDPPARDGQTFVGVQAAVFGVGEGVAQSMALEPRVGAIAMLAIWRMHALS